MIISIDLAKKSLIRLGGSSTSVETKRRDVLPIEVRFYDEQRNAVKLPIPNEKLALVYACKENLKYSGPLVVAALTEDWTIPGDEDEDLVYTTKVNFNTPELDELFGEDPDEKKVVALMGEITWWNTDTPGAVSSTKDIPHKILNDIYRGDEGMPTSPIPAYPATPTNDTALVGKAGAWYKMSFNELWTELSTGGVILDSNEVVSIESDTRCLFDGSELLCLDWEQRQLAGMDNWLSIDWGARRLKAWSTALGSTATTVAWEDGILNNLDERKTLDWMTSQGFVNTGVFDLATLDWNQLALYSINTETYADTLVSVNWQERQLYHTSGTASVLWGNGNLFDPLSDTNAANWFDRMLYSNSGQSIDWQNKVMHGDAFVTVGWQDGILYSWDGAEENQSVSVNWMTQELVGRNYGVSMVRWNDGVLADSSGVPSVSWAARTLRDADGNQVYDWHAGSIFDIGGVASSNFVSRSLHDDSGMACVFWNTRALLDETNNLSLNWSARLLGNSSSNITLDWESMTLTDPFGYTSLNWNYRVLNNSDLFTTVDWQAGFLNSPSGVNNVSWMARKLHGQWTVADAGTGNAGGNIIGQTIVTSAATSGTVTPAASSLSSVHLHLTGSLAATMQVQWSTSLTQVPIGGTVAITSENGVTALTVSASGYSILGTVVNTLSAGQTVEWRKITANKLARLS